MKKYERPIVEIVEFDNLDVIVMSSGTTEPIPTVSPEPTPTPSEPEPTPSGTPGAPEEQESPLENSEENTAPDTNGTEGDSSASQEPPTADEPAPEAPVEPVPETPADPIIPDASEPAVVPEAETDIPVDTGMGVL